MIIINSQCYTHKERNSVRIKTRRCLSWSSKQFLETKDCENVHFYMGIILAVYSSFCQMYHIFVKIAWMQLFWSLNWRNVVKISITFFTILSHRRIRFCILLQIFCQSLSRVCFVINLVIHSVICNILPYTMTQYLSTYFKILPYHVFKLFK